jgi:hypothetical protein
LVNDGPKKFGKDGQQVYKDPDTPEWPEYNTTKVRMINLMNDVLSVDDLNTIFVCHTKFQKKTGKIEPDFPQATASAFISMVHSIYYCDKEDAVENGKPVVRFPIELVSGEQTVSKNRIGGLPRKVYDVEPIAQAFLEWNADVIAKKTAKAHADTSVATVPETSNSAQGIGGGVVAGEMNDTVETKVIESAGPDDKDSIIATPDSVIDVPTVEFTAPANDDFDDLFA